MQQPISFNEVKIRYADLIPIIEEKKSKSTSVSKDAPLEDCDWFINWCLEFQSQSFAEIMEAKAKDITDCGRSNDFETDFQDRLSHVGHISLICKKKRGSWFTALDKEKYGIPKEVEESIRQECLERQKENERWNRLTPEQQEEETKRNLAEMYRQSGFSVSYFRH